MNKDQQKRIINVVEARSEKIQEYAEQGAKTPLFDEIERMEEDIIDIIEGF